MMVSRPALLVVGLAFVLTGCAGGAFRPVSDTPVRLGAAYRVKGTTYVPAADPRYDVLGYASWYDSESGNRTASGERFRADWITAAHTTLPLPTYVEVTALDTGQRIIVRINDRGPFAGRARIIDLSRGAAARLGVGVAGSAAVRVRRVEPTESDRERLRKGKPARGLPPVSERERPKPTKTACRCGLLTPIRRATQTGRLRSSKSPPAAVRQNLAIEIQ